MIVVYDTLGAYGGSHTLMLRMCQWMTENHIKAAIICKDNTNTEIVNKLKKIKVRIIREDMSNASKGIKVLKLLLQEENIKVINFSWNNYLDVERIKKKYHIFFDNILYCIHPATFKKGIGFKTKLMRNYSKMSYRKIFERMNDNNAIISLDEINIEESEKYLECVLDVKPQIIRLPMFCEERADCEDIIRNGYNSQTILTAARADFPYKGYMIGLVGDYYVLKKRYPALKLEIVSSGDDYDQLLERINAIPEAQKKDIVLHGWMEYDTLKETMRKCRVFIGMGTSVFDAALQYKPSIVVKYNTLENLSDHFISERPEYMGADFLCKELAIRRLEQAMNWDFDTYRYYCKASFASVKNLYDVNICMKQLIRISTKHKESILSGFECTRHKINHMINEIRFRNRRFADYKAIVKEE